MFDPLIGDAVFDERSTRARVRQIQKQVRRIAIPDVVHEAFVSWLLWNVGLRTAAMTWLVASAVLHGVRARYVQLGMRTPSPDPRHELKRLSQMYVALGVGRGILTLVLFSVPITDAHYIYTMLVVGLAAGGVGSVGGLARTYIAWSVAVAVPLAAGWVLQGTVVGSMLTFVIVGMFLTLCGAVRDQGVALEHLVASAHENQLLAESLRFERDKAQSANQSKTRFFAAASHDLRQPLHALSINATTLELVARSHADPLVTELSQGINRALRQSNSLLDGLLDISRLDANAVEVRLEPIDVAHLLSTVRDEFSAIAAQRHLALRVELQPGAALTVHTDEDLIKRVLGNMVSNSLKFTASGEVVLSAASRESGADAAVRSAVIVSVRDSGPGIPKAEQERVFEEFYQIGNASRDRTLGLGLGLSIVKRIAELLGIPLQMISEPGQGTVFNLTVPSARAAASARNAHDPEGDIARVDARILVIDDEPEILESLAGLLPLLGCEVRVADGRAAAQRVIDEGFDPDALLVDHRLRHETGLELIAKLTRAGSDQPIDRPALLITGDTAPRNIQQAHASGLRVLHKPVDGRKLAVALAEVLREARAAELPA